MFKGKGKNITTVILGSILILIGAVELFMLFQRFSGINLTIVMGYNLFGGGAMVYYAISTMNFRKGHVQQSNPEDYLIDLDFEENAEESTQQLTPLNGLQWGAGVITFLVALYTLIRLLFWIGELEEIFKSEFGFVALIFMLVAIPIQLVPMFLLGHNTRLNAEVKKQKMLDN